MVFWMQDVRARACTGAMAAAILSGCAGVDFYSDGDLKNKTGIPIYGAKAYVLVARTQSKDKPVEISLQYITDRSQVIYASPRSGFGSADLKIYLDHGQLTQFGQITDTKVPELLNAVGGLLTARATAAKTFAEADDIKSKIGAGTTQAAKVPDQATVNDIKALLKDMSGPEAQADIAKLDSSETTLVNRAGKALFDVVDAVAKPEKASLLPALGDQLIVAAKDFATLPPPQAAASQRATALQRIADWKPRLAAIAGKLAPDPVAASGPDFELYEILQSGGAVSLRRVQ